MNNQNNQQWEDPKFNDIPELEAFIASIRFRLGIVFVIVALTAAYFDFSVKKKLPLISEVNQEKLREEVRHVCIVAYIKAIGKYDPKRKEGFGEKIKRGATGYPDAEIVKYFHNNYLGGTKYLFQFPAPQFLCNTFGETERLLNKLNYEAMYCNDSQKCILKVLHSHPEYMKAFPEETKVMESAIRKYFKD